MPVAPNCPRKKSSMHLSRLKTAHSVGRWKSQDLPWSTVACAALVGVLACGGPLLWAQRPGRPPVSSGGDVPATQGLWISSTPLDESRLLLLVVDPQLKNAAVYHVDGAQGTLTLKSARNITWDLMVGDFNAQDPKPAALRRMLETAPESAPPGQNRP